MNKLLDTVKNVVNQLISNIRNNIALGWLDKIQGNIIVVRLFFRAFYKYCLECVSVYGQVSKPGVGYASTVLEPN